MSDFLCSYKEIKIVAWRASKWIG